MKKYLFLAASAAVVLFSSCGNSTKASFNDEADTLLYEIGMSDSQQFQQMISRNAADSADFIKGFIEGYKADTAHALQAYYQGFMTGMQARSQMIPYLEAQVYGDDSTKSLKHPNNYLAGLLNALQNKTKLKINGMMVNPAIAFSDAQKRLQGFQEKQLAKEYAEDKKANEEYLAKKHKEGGMTDLADGVFYKELTKGTGEAIADENVIVDYTYETRVVVPNDSVIGSSQNGEKRSEPIKRAQLFQMLPGLKTAVSKMHVGDEWEIYLPYDQAFGARGYSGASVPPFSTIVAKIKVLATHEAPAPKQPAAKPADAQNQPKK